MHGGDPLARAGEVLALVPWLPSAGPGQDQGLVLHASRGSISMATRTLIRMGTVERQTKRGDRRTYYRIRSGIWTAVFEQQIQNITKLRQLSKQGLGLLNDEPATRRDRLQELHDFTTFYERECLALIARWHRDRGQEL